MDYQAIPILSKDIISRKDSNGILLFQVQSDEMYFVTPVVYQSVIAKCDGSKTLAEISGQFPDSIKKNDLKIFEQFIDDLIKRNIIALW